MGPLEALLRQSWIGLGDTSAFLLVTDFAKQIPVKTFSICKVTIWLGPGIAQGSWVKMTFWVEIT